ncbi:unnamed protein product [Closterium sp. Naga37s-1]|nr:unnamed protein product [Closterium sp. Naga37s-1]
MPLPVPPPPCAGDTLCEAAVKVLRTADPWKKADYGDLAAHLWATGAIRHAYADRATLRDGSLSSGSAEARSAGSQGDADAGAAGSDEEQWLSVPDRPARDDTVSTAHPVWCSPSIAPPPSRVYPPLVPSWPTCCFSNPKPKTCYCSEFSNPASRRVRSIPWRQVRVVAARDMPRRGKGGSQQSRVALLHSLVHIESWAVDLAWVRARPTPGQGLGPIPLPSLPLVPPLAPSRRTPHARAQDIIARFGSAHSMPRAFFSDFVRVAEDEARHFRLLAARLQALGSRYGALPAHDGLWESAAATAGDLKARLAIEHCVHEVGGGGGGGGRAGGARGGRQGQGGGASPLPHSHGLRQQYSHSSLPSLLRAPLLSTHHPPIPLAPAPAWQARGLDVVPQTIERFRAGGDSETAELLEQVVYPEEVTHCAAGARWFCFLCLRDLRARQGGEGGREEEAAGGGGGGEGGTLRGEALGSETAAVGRSESEDGDGDGKDEVKAERPGKAGNEGVGGAAEQGMGEEEVSAEEHAAIVAGFHGIVRQHFRGKLKPPFNHEARAKAGLTRDWYEPLAE